jgi:hypothetical protein
MIQKEYYETGNRLFEGRSPKISIIRWSVHVSLTGRNYEQFRWYWHLIINLTKLMKLIACSYFRLNTNIPYLCTSKNSPLEKVEKRFFYFCFALFFCFVFVFLFFYNYDRPTHRVVFIHMTVSEGRIARRTILFLLCFVFCSITIDLNNEKVCCLFSHII